MRDLQCAEHVEIIGHDADRGIGFVIRARLFEMFFLRGLRLHLFDDAVFLDAVRFKVVGHALRFHDRFIRPFATGDDANGARIFVQIVDCGVKTIPQHFART